jgi:tetratricopeptide (TPR) repeat protein
MNLESQVESYFGSLAGTPDDLDVLARLERLYGERGEWAGLVSALERRAVAGGAYAARLWMEAARLSAVRLQDMDRSALALEQAIDLAPAGALGHELDILTLALQQSWDELEGVFAQSVEALGSPAEQSQLYAALGQILAEIVGDAAQADEMFQFAQELDPTRLRVRWARQQLARGAEQWERLSELLYAELEQTQDAAEQVQLMLELGEVYLDKLDQAEAAGQCFARVYEADPSNARARAGLTRLGYELEEAVEAPVAEAPAVEASEVEAAPMTEEITPMTEEIALEEVVEQAPVAPPAAPVVEEIEAPVVVEEAVAAEETAAVEASAVEEVVEAPAVE